MTDLTQAEKDAEILRAAARRIENHQWRYASFLKSGDNLEIQHYKSRYSYAIRDALHVLVNNML